MKKAACSVFPAVAGTLLLASAAGAQNIEAARAAYAEGRFLDAAELGEALETSEGYALAAESLAIHGYYVAAEDDQPELFARAIRAADEAIRLDPDSPQAHFQSAHAIGREAQTVGIMEALNRGYARRTRQAVEEALRLAPEMAEAHLTLATWHTEIVNKVGRLVAGMTYRGLQTRCARVLRKGAGTGARRNNRLPGVCQRPAVAQSKPKPGAGKGTIVARTGNPTEGCVRPHHS